jgi:hypothetical protein
MVGRSCRHHQAAANLLADPALDAFGKIALF